MRIGRAPRETPPSEGCGAFSRVWRFWAAAGLLNAALPSLAAAQAPDRFDLRVGVARGGVPHPLDTIWNPSPVVSVIGAIPFRGLYLEAGVSLQRLIAYDPAPFDLARPLEHPADLTVGRPFVGVGATARGGRLEVRGGGRIGIDWVRFDREGFDVSDPVEMEWGAGFTGAVSWRLAPAWSVGLTGDTRKVFNKERAWFHQLGVEVEAGGRPPPWLGRLLAGTGDAEGMGDQPVEALPEGDAGNDEPGESACRVPRPGVFRLSDVVQDRPGWRRTGIWDFRWSYAPRGLGWWEGRQPEVWVDGLPAGPEFLGSAGLDRVSLALDEVDCVHLAQEPRMAGGRIEPLGGILIRTRRPAEGVALVGGWTAGSEEGDPGVWAYTDRASVNVDKGFGSADALLEARRGAGWLRGGIGNRYVYPTDPRIRARTEAIWPESEELVRLWVRPVWVRGGWDGDRIRVDATAGHSAMPDLVRLPRSGLELRDTSTLAHAAGRVRLLLSPDLSVSARASWSRSGLRGRGIPGPTSAIYVTGRRGDVEVGVGGKERIRLRLGGEEIRLDEAGGEPGSSRRLWGGISGDGRVGRWGTHGAAQLSLESGAWHPALLVTAGRDLGGGHVRLRASSTWGGHLGDRSEAGMWRLASGDLKNLVRRSASADLPDRELHALDAEFRAGPWSAGTYLRLHRGVVGFSTEASLPLHLEPGPPMDGSVVGGWLRWVGRRGAWSGEAEADAGRPLGPSEFKAAAQAATAPQAVLRATWRADERVDLWARGRGRGSSAFPPIGSEGNGTGASLPAWAALDLGGSLRLLGGALGLHMAVRNVTATTPVAWHPEGVAEERGLYVRARLRLGMLR